MAAQAEASAPGTTPNHRKCSNFDANASKPLRTYSIAGCVANDINDNAFDDVPNLWEE